MDFREMIAADPMRGRSFFGGSGGTHDAASLAIFGEAGVSKARAKNAGGPTFPWGEVWRGRGMLPFNVDVEYRWCAEPLLGGGGYVRYVCLFGYVVEVENEETVQF
jgi:hypothetical protein